ncbi:sulfatase family protein [Labilibacter marinus]|uniref:sulfatase family protein n=1 Tax=Labilibacter marinus TaxID=1477105 RepID=UPI00082BDF4C|nr:sulfatase [Labilibacter marinus]
MYINKYFVLCALLFGTVVNSLNAKEPNKPNLVIIHTDEHSFRTLSCYQKLMSEDQAFIWGKGNNVHTPNIDRIADEGAICTRYYASSPVCTPSRASLITGLYPQATGAPKNGDHIRQDIKTFGHILKENGYATSYVGKWHLDGHSKYTFGIKYKAGFSDNTYMMRGGHAPYLRLKKDGTYEGLGDKAAAKHPKEEIIHMTDFFTNKTLEILERDKDQPFCLMLSIPDPHTPDYARPPYNTMYNHMKLKAPVTMSPELQAKKPMWGKSASEDKNEAFKFNATALKQYFGMVKHIDDKVGEILAFLDENKLTENTIIVFTADHGDMFYEHNRRNKGVPYEASAKIPFVIRYPKKVKAGKVIKTAYNNIDFAPTVLGLMGVDTKVPFHGIDTSEDFMNNKDVVEGDRITYFAKTGGWWVAAVDNQYKLVLDKKEKPWLLDIKEDPNELINFYGKEGYKEIGEKLQKELFIQMKKFKEPGLVGNKTPYVSQ